MNQKKKMKSNRGFGLVEVVVASAIIALFIGVLVGVFTFYLQSSLAGVDRVKAAFLAEEGLEAVRFLAKADWESFETLDLNETYYLDFNEAGSSWSISQNPNLIDEAFEREILFEEVYRDSDDRIADSGDLDPGTLKVTSRVFWPASNPQVTHTISTYLTDI